MTRNPQITFIYKNFQSNYLILLLITSLPTKASKFQSELRSVTFECFEGPVFSLATKKYSPSSLTNKEMHITNGNITGFQFKDLQTNNICKLRLAHINIGGGLKHKMEEMENIFDTTSADIIGVSESNQLKDDHIETNNINYNFYSGFNYHPSKTRLGVFVKKGIKVKVLTKMMKSVEIPSVWLEISVRNQKIFVINAYREHKKWLPKSMRNESKESEKVKNQLTRFQGFVDAWSKLLDHNMEVWMLGDFNIDEEHV